MAHVPDVVLEVIVAAPDTESASVGVAAAVAEALHVDRGAERSGFDRELVAVREPRRERGVGEAARPRAVAERELQRGAREMDRVVVRAVAAADLRGQEIGPALELRDLEMAAVRLRRKEKEREQRARARHARRTRDRLDDAHVLAHAPRVVARRPPLVDGDAPPAELEPAAALTDLVEAARFLDHATAHAREARQLLLRGQHAAPLELARRAVRARLDDEPEPLERLEHLDAQRSARGLIARAQRARRAHVVLL